MPPTAAPPPPADESLAASATTHTAGRGELRFAHVAGQTAITRCRSSAPLKFLTPTRRGDAAWAYANTFGGGLVAGDRIDLTLDTGPDTTAVLTTQASTKVFHQQAGRGAEQHLTAAVGDHAKLLVLPDPLTCFADAIYRQTQRFSLASAASLVLLDWFTAGRTGSGERWAFAEYRNLNTVSIDGREVLFDQTRITADTLAAAGASCVGSYQVIANLFLVGPALRDAAAELQSWVDTQPIRDEAGYVAGYSQTAWGGVLRLAGRDVQTVTDLLKQRLYFTHPWLGGCPWGRKW